jgi:hypothetical protein
MRASLDPKQNKAAKHAENLANNDVSMQDIKAQSMIRSEGNEGGSLPP